MNIWPLSKLLCSGPNLSGKGLRTNFLFLIQNCDPWEWSSVSLSGEPLRDWGAINHLSGLTGHFTYGWARAGHHHQTIQYESSENSWHRCTMFMAFWSLMWHETQDHLKKYLFWGKSTFKIKHCFDSFSRLYFFLAFINLDRLITLLLGPINNKATLSHVRCTFGKTSVVHFNKHANRIINMFWPPPTHVKGGPIG